MKVLSIIGTRPEAIKMAPVIRALQNDPQINSCVCSTGQHTDLLTPILDFFDVKPTFNLNTMAAGQSLSSLTAKIIVQVNEVLEQYKPDFILVHGDTTTAMAAALAGFYNQINIAHVEAGLRTKEINNPFPEEMNRRFISKISSLNFAPTKGAFQNLIDDQINEEKIFITGNTVVDALMFTKSKLETSKKIKRNRRDKNILVTCHRRENAEYYSEIFEAIKEISQFQNVSVTFPVHPNPRVRDCAFEILGGQANVKLINPLGYIDFVSLMMEQDLILTDSGGIQEEAPSLGIPVLVMRNETERPEAVEAGTAFLVGNRKHDIVRLASKHIEATQTQDHIKLRANPYGDGTAAIKITEKLKEAFESHG